MLEIMGLKITKAKLALRIVIAIILGAIIFIMFYLIPSNPYFLLSLFKGSLPFSKEVFEILTSLASQAIDPNLPIVGALLTIIIPISTILSKTKVHGPLIMINNGLLVYFFYTLFRGGFITLSIPTNLPLGLSGWVKLELPFIIQIIILPFVLNIIKGVLITVESLAKLKSKE